MKDVIGDAYQDMTGRKLGGLATALLLALIGVLHWAISSELNETHDRLSKLEEQREIIRDKGETMQQSLKILHTEMKNMEEKMDDLSEKVDQIHQSIYSPNWEGRKK